MVEKIRSVATFFRPLKVYCVFLFSAVFSLCFCGNGCSDHHVSPAGHGSALVSSQAGILIPYNCPPAHDTPAYLPYPPEYPDWIVLTTTEWVKIAEKWAAYRRSTGHTPLVLTMSEILAGRPMTATEFLETLHSRLKDIRTRLPSEIPMYLMLLGNPTIDPKKTDEYTPVSAESVPTFTWKNKFYTDAPYADLTGDGLPDIAVGRIPADVSARAFLVLEKTIRYESTSPPGYWRHNVLLFASEGDFGTLVDALLEKVGIEMVKNVPDRWRIRFIHARKHSPYTVPPAEYSRFLNSEFDNGALLSVYLGHGYPEALERARWSREDAGPIMDMETIRDIRCGPRCPVMVLVACHTGRPLGGDGLAERIVLLPETSPAVIGSTEESHPYPNALIVSALNREVLWRETPTIGEVFRKSLRILGSDETANPPETEEIEALASLVWKKNKRNEMKVEHLSLYSLYGDPGLRLPYPEGRIELSAHKDAFSPGETVFLCARIAGPVAGHLKVTVETPREVMAHEPERWTDKMPERNFIIEQNWKQANDKTLMTKHVAYEKGYSAFPLRLPRNLRPGVHLIRAELAGSRVDAAGSIRIMVEGPSAEAGAEAPSPPG